VELQRSAPLYQQVYQILRRQILQGEYTAGGIVQESRTAEMLRVSRTPVREALRQLEREGLLVTQGSERVVANPTKEEFIDLYTCRAALEGIVAERSALLADPSDIDFMAGAIEEARAAIPAGDHAGVLSANTRFHDRMVESARMKPLRQLMDTIRGQILVARRRLLTNAEVEAAICDEHEEILDAIRRKDVRAAQERMERHMKNDIERGVASFDG
jgi:DNA-binding GntR family transcriptional regulator